MEFEHEFRRLILERGYNYYLNDLVTELKIDHEDITAIVIGSKNYFVSIQRRDGQIGSLYCDCPYFESGDNCKHLAAVLYTVNELENEAGKEVHTKSDLDNAVDLLDLLSYEELYAFLKEELATDRDLRFRFNTKFQFMSDYRDCGSYVSHIDLIFEQHLGYEDFIEYNKVTQFEMDVGEVIEAVHGLAEDGEYLVAFTLIKHLVNRLDGLGIDDSLGTTGSLMADLMEILGIIINNSSDQVYNQVFQWVCTQLDGGVIDTLEDDIFDMFHQFFKDEEKLRKKIEVIDEILDNLGEPTRYRWSDNFRFARLLKTKIAVLIELKRYEDMQQVVQKYIYLPEIRKIAIEEHIEREELEEAIHLLVEGKRLYKDWPGIVRDYSTQLIDLYRCTDSQSELMEECRRRLLRYDPKSLTAYKEYKSLFSNDDWEIEREAILSELKETRCDIKVYYAEEGLMQELFAEIREDPNYRGLDSYEHLLYNEFTEELRSLLLNRIEEMAVHSRGRKYYRLINQELKRLAKYPGGEELVYDLKNKWRVTYRNRPAMMEELEM